MSYLARFSTALDVDILASILDGDDIEDVLTGKLVNRQSFSCFQQQNLLIGQLIIGSNSNAENKPWQHIHQ